MKSSERVVKNTGFLYGKMLITISVSLFSTRLILNALGATDYGIFNLVGGVIAMLSFINSAMIIATQRYLSFYMGAGDEYKLKSVFNSSVILHLIIGLIIVLLLEIGGLFLFDGVLNIPVDRIATAKIVFHFMVVSTFFTINAVPYDASINSHENFLFDAILGIFESILKLGIAIWLVHAEVDKLILFGLLTAGLTIFIRIIKGIYCSRKYEECRVRIRSYVQIGLLKEMLSFAGWNLFGLLCSVLRQQGMAILLNIFFGVVVNAAYGIANQVNANLSHFSTNMLRAILPQITKSGGSGDHERMLRLSALACKMSLFLMAFFAIPIIIEMSFILHIWLKTVPENTIIFCQLILIFSLLYQLTYGLMAAITTVGKIKVYQVVVGMVEIFNLPLAWVLIKFGLPAYSVFAGSIFLEVISGYLRLWFAHKIAGIDIKDFLTKTYLPSILSVVISLLLGLAIRFSLEEGILRAILVLIITTLSISLSAWNISLVSGEREKITELFMSFYFSIRKKFNMIRNTKS